jgi:3-oxoacyl-[acyl-carrier protein] reductase
MQDKIQHAVITGGTGSLGQEIARAMQAPDWSIEAPGSLDLDMRDEPAIRRYFKARDVDLLVCAAGVTTDAPLVKLSAEAWDHSWQVNYRGAAACAAAVLPGMIQRGSGHIVLISSYSALHPPVGQAAYATAKSALIGLVADLARRHGRFNIRVNAILPGFMETRMTEPVTASRRASITADHALGRFNTCKTTARFVCFLHHQLPDTSGQVFQLDSRTDFAGFCEQ